MKLSHVILVAIVAFAAFVNAAVAADIKYKANLPIAATQRSDVIAALNPGTTVAA